MLLTTYAGTHFHYVAANGQVDMMVRGMLTRSTRHGLTARLGALQCLGWDMKAVYRIRRIADLLR
jgi:hypothetical protein